MAKTRPNPTKRTTIKDVARHAGVSVTTVSNALNGRTAAMTADTLERIQHAIRALNYRPNRVARSLVTSRTATIGIIIAEIETPLFLRALNTIETIARAANYNILLCTARNLADEKQAVNLLLEKQVDGLIFLSTSIILHDNYLLELPPSAPPMVLVNHTTRHHTFSHISFEHDRGVVAAIDYLVGLGHRRIAHLVGPDRRQSTHARMAGYRLGLKKHGLPAPAEYLQPGDFEADPGQWERSTLTLLACSPRPTAIIAANDIVAATVMRVIQRAGLRAPADVSVIGIDDQPFCAWLNPGLTTVRLPVAAAGERAVNLLLQHIADSRPAFEHLTLPCQLIVRESSGPPPAPAA